MMRLTAHGVQRFDPCLLARLDFAALKKPVSASSLSGSSNTVRRLTSLTPSPTFAHCFLDIRRFRFVCEFSEGASLGLGTACQLSWSFP